MIQRVIIDLSGAAPRVVRLQMPADQHRSTLCDDIACRGGSWSDVEWYPDGSHLAFVSTSRDHKHEALRIADATTGAIRDVLEETAKTQFESGNGRVNWHVLPASNEVIWFSERDNWGQLYLYDLTTGKLKHQITTGDGNVTQLVRIDETKRELYFHGVGKEKGRDPYFRHFYKIGMDGKGLTLLTPENADHDASLSPIGQVSRRHVLHADDPADDRRARLERQAARHARESRHLAARRHGLEAADADHRESARRQDGSLRLDVHADQSRLDEEVSDHQPHLPGPADRLGRRPHVQPGARRCAGARRARVRRRRDRRHGHAVAFEGVSRRLLRATWATTRCPIRSPA